jgi:5'(3')-deoxyribonucleotidase
MVILDIDGVVWDHNRFFLERVNGRYGTSYKFTDIVAFRYGEFLPEEHANYIYKLWHSPDLYEMDECLMPGALSGIECLQQITRVVAVSSPLEGHIESKYRWLVKTFGRRDIALLSDKNLVYKPGRIMVDDAIHNLKEWPGKTICFDQPWNHDYPTKGWYRRARGWPHLVSCVRWHLDRNGEDDD